jgi:tRNA(adenine34) deaminase
VANPAPAKPVQLAQSKYGELAERTKAHDWKSCVGQLTVGSNPTLSAVTTDEQFLAAALAEARLATVHDDVPIGAVVVVGGDIVAARHNERELTGDPTAHAEVLALRDAAAKLGSWRLDSATLYVTLEPCVMCAGALSQARIARCVFGAYDLKAGSLGSLYNVGVDARLNHEFAVRGGVAADEAAELLTAFFAAKRS